MRRVLVLGVLFAAACSDALEQSSSAGQYVGFVTGQNSLLLLAATDLTLTVVQLPGSAQRLAGRGSVFLASLGTSQVAVVDLTQNPASARAIGLSVPSGAASVVDAVMADDSIAWVALLQPYAARVNYRTGLVSMVFLGGGRVGTPVAVAVTAGLVFVAQNAGATSPSFLTVVNPVTKVVIDTVVLTPAQARLAVVGDDSLLYIVTSRALNDSGRVSVVDPVARQELAVINGLGTFPWQALFHPAGSRLLVGSPYSGIQEVNAITKTLIRPPSEAVRPGGHSVLGLAIDQGGMIYAADSSCAIDILEPPPDYSVRRVVPVPGVLCPTYGAVATRP
ncbi:MAG TPA: hypothetical protein VM736_08105 [Gemmatimonadales bacterium]|nr:hypothetical protein [Gemmatimonadales bacterium]